jgi:hypothetical protein
METNQPCDKPGKSGSTDRQPHAGHTTDDVIELLTKAVMGQASDAHRQMYVDALRALVRLAKQEKLYEIKRDVAQAIGMRRTG